jgi:hypothetical protein
MRILLYISSANDEGPVGGPSLIFGRSDAHPALKDDFIHHYLNEDHENTRVVIVIKLQF